MNAEGMAVFARWTALWNGDLALAGRIMAPRFTLRYAQPGTESFDAVHTPEALADVIAARHRDRPGMRFEVQGQAVVSISRDAEGRLAGLVASPYGVRFASAHGREIAVSGVDVLLLEGGLICEVWSASGGPQGRSFYGLASGSDAQG